jgi:hypothetical protein
VSFDSEVRIGACGNIRRTSESGHQHRPYVAPLTRPIVLAYNWLNDGRAAPASGDIARAAPGTT